MLPRLRLQQVNCCEMGFNPSTGREGAIGQDFCYAWDRVKAVAIKREVNLDTYVSLPLVARLFEKKLSSPVAFWYTPLNDLFVITVCSKRNVDFMDPLHSLPGYAEYGQAYLRPIARPFVYWDGKTVYRLHPIGAETLGTNLVADFGNLFGLTVAESDADQYQEIRKNPTEYFEYAAVPEEPEQHCNWNGKNFVIQHALCVVEQ